MQRFDARARKGLLVNDDAASRMSIAVVGLGNIGAALAVSLAAAGRHDVTACARRPLARMTLERPEGTVEVDMRTVTDPHDAQRADWVMLCTKAQQTPSTAPWLARLCDARTRVVVLQNGIDHVARVAPFAQGATIVPAIVYYNGERYAPDHVRLRHVTSVDIAVASTTEGRAFAHLVEGAPLTIGLNDDFTTLAWRKLLMNSIANPITSLTLQRQVVLRRPDILELCREILTEAVAVGLRDGARLEPDEVERMLNVIHEYPAEGGTSMYFDRLAGRELEAEAITGAIVRAGERHGVAVPHNRALLALLRAISDAHAAAAT